MRISRIIEEIEMGKIIYFLLLLLVFSAEQCPARPLFVGSSEGMDFQVEEVIGGLGVPWGMTFYKPIRAAFYRAGRKDFNIAPEFR